MPERYTVYSVDLRLGPLAVEEDSVTRNVIDVSNGKIAVIASVSAESYQYGPANDTSVPLDIVGGDQTHYVTVDVPDHASSSEIAKAAGYTVEKLLSQFTFNFKADA